MQRIVQILGGVLSLIGAAPLVLAQFVPLNQTTGWWATVLGLIAGGASMVAYPYIPKLSLPSVTPTEQEEPIPSISATEQLDINAIFHLAARFKDKPDALKLCEQLNSELFKLRHEETVGVKDA